MRDEFTDKVRGILAARAGYRCSRPECYAATSGPQSDLLKTLNLGVAAHITAASSGGPRFDASLSIEERCSAANGIWLCQNCGKLVDNDRHRFTLDVLRQWKNAAEANALARIGQAIGETSARPLSSEEIELLYHAADEGDLWMISTNGGDWIRSGRRDFLTEDLDPGYSAVYIDALESLVAKRLVRHSEQMYYRLTGEGFRVARQLAG